MFASRPAQGTDLYDRLIAIPVHDRVLQEVGEDLVHVGRRGDDLAKVLVRAHFYVAYLYVGRALRDDLVHRLRYVHAGDLAGFLARFGERQHALDQVVRA